MVVAAVRVGLPNLHPGAFDRLTLEVHDPPHHMDHLSLCTPLLASDRGQIRVLIQRFEHGIKRPQDLPRRPLERLGQRGTDTTGYGQAAEGDRHLQEMPARDAGMSTPVDSLLSRVRSRETPKMVLQKALKTVTAIDVRHWFSHGGYALQ